MTTRFTIQGRNSRDMPAHFIPAAAGGNELVIFVHGYKGFKDWGPWELSGYAFAKANYNYLAFNFSHNGGTIEDPIDFPDEEAFGKNTYSIELSDLNTVLDYIDTEEFKSIAETTISRVHLVGHSRGGGMVVLAGNHPVVSSITTWSAVSDYGTRFPVGEALEKWKNEGVYHIKNGRTGQLLPHQYSFYTDYQENQETLSIPKLARALKKPILIIHGTADEAVKNNQAEQLQFFMPHAQLQWINDAGHTYGGKHPWDSDELPEDLSKVVATTVGFIDKV